MGRHVSNQGSTWGPTRGFHRSRHTRLADKEAGHSQREGSAPAPAKVSAPEEPLSLVGTGLERSRLAVNLRRLQQDSCPSLHLNSRYRTADAWLAFARFDEAADTVRQ